MTIKSRHRFTQSALAIIAGVFAAALAPGEQITPTAWAAKNMKIADGEYAGQMFKADMTPYLTEVLDFFSDDCPDNKAVIRKSKQAGFTTLAIAAVGFTIDVQPCDLFLIEPTSESLAEFVSLKLQPTIDGSAPLKKKVHKQVSRSGKGSTQFVKRFAGGTLLMSIATSSAALRGKTRKKVIRDEASEYARDLAKQGSPHEMISGSYETFLASGNYKDLWISTPTNKGQCWISEEFEKGDQRYWHVPCPGCGHEFVLDLKNFKYESAYPYKAHFAAPCCGSVIDGAAKNAVVRKGRWIATASAPGKFRSYHFDGFASPFVPLDVIAQRIVEAGDDPAKLKPLNNLTFGLAYEPKGDAPDWTRLMERREDYKRGEIPARGYLLTCGADVQHSGIWYEVVAWSPDAQSWSIDHGFLEGETTDHSAGAFAQLAKLMSGTWGDAFNARRSIDALAIDAGDGGRANQVYAWTRTQARTFAIKGVSGWTAPAIGTPTRVSITLSGKKMKGGATLWPVGTWSLKHTFYSHLNKDGIKAGADLDPPGYCHYHEECDERFFKQQTAEYLKTQTYQGRTVRVWQESGPNHLLDCRVYAMAMAEYLGLSRMTADQWAVLAQRYGVPAELQNPDMFAPEALKIAAAPTVHAPLLGQAPGGGRRMRSDGVS